MVNEPEQIERTIANEIIEKNGIYVLRETEEFCLYNGGFFHKGPEPYTEIREYINKISKRTQLPTADPRIMKPYSLTISRRNAILEIIKMETFVSINEFDKKSNRICVLNGHLRYNIEKSEWDFIEHFNYDENPYKTFIQIPVEYDPKAECLELDQCLSDIFGFETVPLIYEMIAYFLMPHILYQKAFMLYGPTGTGKTTFITILERFLNAERYFSGLSLQELGERFQMKNLMNKILNVFDDLTDEPIGDTKSFRQVVTNERLDSEVKHLPDHVQWRNRTKLLFSCNNLPPVRKKETDAFFRRWVLIACFTTFKDKDMMTFEDEQDPTILPRDYTILKKICTPLQFSGLLNKILEAWIRLEERGKFSKEWQDIDYIKNLWMIDINPIGLFVNECCIVNPIEKVDYGLFHKIVNKFRAEHNAMPITRHACTQWLNKIEGISKKRKSAGKARETGEDYYYQGIGIKDSILKKFAPENLEIQEKVKENIDKYLEDLEEESSKRERDFSDPHYFDKAF